MKQEQYLHFHWKGTARNVNFKLLTKRNVCSIKEWNSFHFQCVKKICFIRIWTNEVTLCFVDILRYINNQQVKENDYQNKEMISVILKIANKSMNYFFQSLWCLLTTMGNKWCIIDIECWNFRCTAQRFVM